MAENRLLSTGHDLITPEDAQRLKVHQVIAGDIIVGRKGDLSRRALIRESEKGWICGTDCIRIRVDRELISPTYLSYYMGLRSVGGWLHRHDTGSTLPSLSTTNLARLPIVLPPRDYQDEIAKSLKVLDDKIEVNFRIGYNALELARANFARSMQHLSRTISLRDVIDLRYGKALIEKDREPGKVPVFGGNGRSGWHSKSLSAGPGIIIGRKGANAGSVSWSQGPFWVIDTAFFVHPLSNDIPLEYLYFLLQKAGFRGQVGDSAIPGLNRDIALSCASMLPQESVMHAVAAELRTLLKLRAQLSDESASLAELRDTLLPKLISGEIWVRDAERIVEGAT
jgi:type I restriction enzyme S subunit